MSRWLTYRTCCLAVVLGSARLLPAWAQMDPVVMGQGLTLSAAILAQANNLAAHKSSAAPTARLTYTSTLALRQQTVRRATQQLQASSPAEAQALTAVFGPGKADYGQVYAAGIKGSGLRDNDAASAFAAYLELGYAIVHNLPDTRSITPAMERGLRAQAAGLVASRLGTPAQVAQFGEEMKLQAVLLLLGWQSSIKGGQLAGYRQGVAQKFSQAGLDLSQLHLGEQGLVKE